MKIQEVDGKEYYIAQSPRDFDNWDILCVEDFKEDVKCVYVRSPGEENIQGIRGFAKIYSKNEFLPYQ